MKNQNAPKLEIVYFDPVDVVTASQPVIQQDMNDSGIPVIWLDRQSVLNYNAYTEGDINLLLSDTTDEYFAYTGTIYSMFSPDYVFAGTRPDEPAMLNTMKLGDKDKYRLLSQWLTTNQKIY